MLSFSIIFQHYITDAEGNQEYNKAVNKDEVYRVDATVSEVFAKRNGQPYYAKKHNQREFYPTIQNRHVTIPGSSDKYYARDEHYNQYYPKDEHGVDQPYIDPSSGKATYARTKNGEEIYPKNKEDCEFVINTQYIINKDGTIKYPLDVNGDPVYDTDPQGNQIYLVVGGVTQIGKNQHGVPVYARRKTSSGTMDEFYPEDGQIAYLQSGEPIYAETSAGEIIFPTDKAKNEIYLKHKLTQADSIYSAGKKLSRYAQDNQGNEVYPRNRKEIVLANRYAKLKSTQVIYPLDENGNEYILYDDAKSDKDNFPIGYPITNDGFVIVPRKDSGEAYISKDAYPKVKAANLLGLIFREGDGYQDYITNVRSGRPSRSTRKRIYQTLPMGPNKPSANPPAQPPPQPNIPVNSAAGHPIANPLIKLPYMSTISISMAVMFGIVVIIILMKVN